MLDAYLDLGDLDLPVMIMPMPVTGTTGPAGLLSNIAAGQRRGALGDRRLPAGPPRPAGDLQQRHRLDGLPHRRLSWAGRRRWGSVGRARRDGPLLRPAQRPRRAAPPTPEPGPEAVIEKLVTMLPPASAGADIVVGFGEIEGDQALVLEQILVDNELAHCASGWWKGSTVLRKRICLTRSRRSGRAGTF